MEEKTTTTGCDSPPLQRLHRVFSSADSDIDLVMERVLRAFEPGTTGRILLEIFEPAIGGFIMALALGCIDLFTGIAAKQSLRHYFLEAAIEHATPFAFFVSFLGIGASLMMAGGALAGPVRTLVVAPLLRLSHHVSMVAVGVICACAWSMVGQSGVGRAAIVVYAGVILAGLGVYSFMANLVFSRSRLRDLERYRSYRWLAFLIGLVLFSGSAASLNDLAAKHGSTVRSTGSDAHVAAHPSLPESGTAPRSAQ